MGNTMLTKHALDAASRVLDREGPVHMINLVRYRAEADYGASAAFPPCSGREAYLQRYVAAFGKVATAVGATFTPVFLGSVQATLLPVTGEAWDDIAIVAYPSFEVLRRIVESEQYEAEAAIHHRAALDDWGFMAATAMTLP